MTRLSQRDARSRNLVKSPGYCIKQIDFILPWVCTLITHRGRQNMVRTSVTLLACGSLRTSLLLHLRGAGLAQWLSIRLHQCGPGSIPGLGVNYGLSLLLVLVLASRGFSPGSPIFPSPHKPTFPNSNSIWNPRATGLSVITLLSVTLVTIKSIYLFIYLFIYRKK